MFFVLDVIKKGDSASLLPPQQSKSQEVYAKIDKLSLKMDFLNEIFSYFNEGVIPDQMALHHRFLKKLQGYVSSEKAFRDRLDKFLEIEKDCATPSEARVFFDAKNELLTDCALPDFLKDSEFLLFLGSINQSRKLASQDLVRRIGFRPNQEKQAFFSKKHLNSREFQIFYKKLLHPVMFKTEGAIRKLSSNSNRLLALSELSSTCSRFVESSLTTNHSLTYLVSYCQDFYLSEYSLDTIEKEDRTENNYLISYRLFEEAGRKNPTPTQPYPLEGEPLNLSMNGSFRAIIKRTNVVALMDFSQRYIHEITLFDHPSCIDMDSTHFVVGNKCINKNKNSKINLVNYKTCSHRKLPRAHLGDVNVVKLTDDRIYSGGQDGIIKIWDRLSLRNLVKINFSSSILEICLAGQGNFFSIAENVKGVSYTKTMTMQNYFFPIDHATAVHYAHRKIYIGTSRGELLSVEPHFFMLRA